MLKQKVPVPLETNPPAIPTMVAPSEGLRSLKHSFLPDMVIEQESNDPNSERVCVKAGPEWVRQECASRFEGVTDRVCFEATIYFELVDERVNTQQ